LKKKLTAEKKITDPYPDSEYGSGSTGPIEYGSNTDPDPKPWIFTYIFPRTNYELLRGFLARLPPQKCETLFIIFSESPEKTEKSGEKKGGSLVVDLTRAKVGNTR
jgi:hypothetical protein